MLNKFMFREYDIRGQENDQELNSQSVELIAKAYGTFLRKRNVTAAVVGHDNRKSSEEFYGIAVRALRGCGVDVVGIGMCLTPMVYWAQYRFEAKGALMVTASHNPAGWNGVKLALGYSYTITDGEVLEVYRLAEGGQFETGEGTYRAEDISQAYIDDLVSRAKLHRKLKVLVNTANATSSFFTPKVLRQFGCEVVEHNTDPDPSYPHYVPNPANVEMMKDTGAQVVKHGCDLGIAVDADGDRLGLCDEKGQTVWPDRYLILLSRLVLAQQPGAKIVFDVKVSEALPEDIAAHGGVPIMWRTGHGHIKKKLAQEGAALAGEQSGHVFYALGYYGFDDAHLAALKLLEYLSAQNEPVSEVIATTPYYVSTPAYHAHVPEEAKYRVVERLTEQFKSEGYRVVDVNGVRAYFKNGGWGLVRASSNLPALVLRFEAKTEQDLREIERTFRDKLKAFPEVASDWVSA